MLSKSKGLLVVLAAAHAVEDVYLSQVLKIGSRMPDSH